MGAKRSTQQMDRLKERFYEGMAANGITGELADGSTTSCWRSPISASRRATRSASRYLVFAAPSSSCYHPAAFCAGLLSAQPMGFYSPQSLVADARRHGVMVRGPDINASLAIRTWSRRAEQGPAGVGGRSVRLGLAAVRAIGTSWPSRSWPNAANGPYADLADLARRVRLTRRRWRHWPRPARSTGSA